MHPKVDGFLIKNGFRFLENWKFQKLFEISETRQIYANLPNILNNFQIPFIPYLRIVLNKMNMNCHMFRPQCIVAI